jgi:hypothetical protein
MSSWHAVVYPIRPGTEDEVAHLFRAGERPSTEIHGPEGEVVARLLSTRVFVGNGKVMRVIEFDGELRQIIAHLRTQPAAQALQARLDDYLDVPPEARAPENLPRFFRDASLECVLVRRHDEPI